MHIIGFGHQKYVGKNAYVLLLTTALKRLDPDISIQDDAFAAKIYEFCHTLYEWAGFKSYRYYLEHTEEKKDFLPAIGKTVREILIKFGTAAVRDQVYQGSWVDYLLKTERHCDFLFITDLRFPNEAKAIKDAGGECIKIVRPGLPMPTDAADTALNDFDCWDQVISNSGTLSDLQAQATKHATNLHRLWETQHGR